MADEPLLRATGVTVRYGDFEALRDVTIEIGADEFVVVLGANAAGKSTLLKACAGIIPTAGGTVSVLGEDVTRTRTADRLARGVVYVPEGRLVFPYMTVEENLRSGAWAPHLRRGQAASLAEVYDLAPRLLERRAQFAGTLSGGEQQMLAICRGLMSRPKLLLIDEPSLGLSPLWMSDVFTLIGRIATMGTAILMVEQNVVRALELADRGYVLTAGQCVRTGTAAELRTDDEVRRAYMGA